MNVWALADPHLGFAVDKPMAVFGESWLLHEAKIAANWQALVAADDIVIVAGDVSWATRFADALPDLHYLDRLPGRKILLRGNHDYWWQTIAKMEAVFAKENITTISFLRYESIELFPGVYLAGSRGWLHPNEFTNAETDSPIYERELARFGLAFADWQKKKQENDQLLAVSHYCPLDRFGNATPLSDLIRDAGAALCLHGHVHNTAKLRQEKDGVVYVNTAADVLDFRPCLIFQDGRRSV